MGRPRKIDIIKMKDLHGKGVSVTHMAKQLGVCKSAVSRQLKKLRLAVTKNVIVEQAPKVVEKNLNAIDQLYHINEVANSILDDLTGEEQTTKRMVQAVKADLDYEKEPTKANLKDLKGLILRINQDKNTAIKACAEIRAQLGLQLDIFKTLYDMEAVAEFQKEVLNIIGETAPDVRERIIKRLKESRALRQSVSID